MLDDRLLAIAVRLANSKLGINMKSVGALLLEQAIMNRIKAREMTRVDYARSLENDLSEQESFCQLLLISESWFEREPDAIAEALLRLRREIDEVHILSAPCARGEESISSLALAVKAGFSMSCISIDGYDASEVAIEQARTFAFGEYSFRGTSDEFRSTFFVRRESSSVLKAPFQSRLKYATGNLLDLGWAPRLPRYELILCRNLLIYLRPKAQKQLLLHLMRHLSATGYLVTTAAEAAILTKVGLTRSSFSASVFCMGKEEREYVPLRRAPPRRPIRIHSPVVAPAKESSRGNSQVELPRQPVEEGTTDQIAQIRALADSGLVDDAYLRGLELLESAPQNAQAHFILGVIASSCGEVEQAKRWIQQALSLDPDHEEALLYLQSLWGGEVVQ